ncbi:hypothetical protein POM88_048318 [Heracleum sosnowskyi]|uniref:ATP-dependent DNA helicase n=1 Tax=Heracleum sosnowskyi TaxID=360622 RepID=A0AAD8GVM8_9APIA|nr:hypothetical protein POM88_048318 [Heracleum sosnowskyi]
MDEKEHFFTSEDMLKGNKLRKRRQSRIRIQKENVNINCSGSSNNLMCTESVLCNSPQINCERFSFERTPTSADSSGITSRQKSLSRDPLSTITNICTESRTTKKNKNKIKATVQFTESTRNLFQDEFDKASDETIDEYHDQLETSIIKGGSYSDGSSDDSNYEFCNEGIDDEEIDTEFDHDNMQFKPRPMKTRAQRTIFPEEYASLGAPDVKCAKCNARLWKEERVNKKVTRGTPIFSICCKKGEVKLPDALPTPPYLMHLYNDKRTTAAFRRNYYSYRLQVRENEGITARLGGRLFQQYLTTDIKKKSYFGTCVGIMYVVEFQKRGFKCIRHFPKKYSPRTVFDESDDILLKRRTITQVPKLILNEKQLEFYALAEIDDLLRSIGKCLKNYPQLPQPPQSYLHHGLNNLIIEETNYNITDLEVEYKKLLENCNQEQQFVYNKILESVEKKEGGLFFVYGSGGCADDSARCVDDDIVIPPQFCDLANENSVENMIKATYPDFELNCKDPKYLSERSILTPTNQTVSHLNSQIVEKLSVFYALPRV